MQKIGFKDSQQPQEIITKSPLLPQNSLMGLPEDLILEILSFLSASQIEQIAPLCKRIKDLTHSDKFVKLICQKHHVTLIDGLSGYSLLKRLALTTLRDNLQQFHETYQRKYTFEIHELNGFYHKKSGHIIVALMPPYHSHDWVKMVISLSKDVDFILKEHLVYKDLQTVSQNPKEQKNVNVREEMPADKKVSDRQYFRDHDYIVPRVGKYVRWIMDQFEFITNEAMTQEESKKSSPEDVYVIFSRLFIRNQKTT